MNRPWSLFLAGLLALPACSPTLAQEARPAQDARPAAEARPAERKEADKDKKEAEEEKPIVTRGEVTVGGRAIKYTATTGFMPLRDLDGNLEAKIFYVAYTADEAGDKAKRPLMFSFNGGPGSSSVWLHMGALGPKRVVMPDGPTIPAPPYQLANNGESWLDRTDLVFIDPVETGYSRAAKPEFIARFHGLRGDIASIGEFIRMYLSRNERWTSPLFLVGESYGTTRAAGLAGYLSGRGIACNGVILISSVIDYAAISAGRGNETPFVLYMPTFAATAWYHKALAPNLQGLSLREFLDRAERFAATDYQAALSKGDAVPDDERARIVEQLARFTGLAPRFVDQSNLRVTPQRFFRELLRDKRRGVGRYDSRYLGIIEDAAGQATEFDPSYAAVQPAYTTTFNQYVRAGLGYKTDVRYNILGSERIGRWDFGGEGTGFPETLADLRRAMAENPALKVWIAGGYYDLATPYRIAAYTRDHMRLDPALKGNVRLTNYEAGHMMYLDAASREQLKRDAATFIDDADGQ